MNFRDLEYLVAVADLGHFGQAAARCHVSQSALSLQLQKLEGELGLQLVERTSRRVVVAEAGRGLVERARAILQARQELLDDAALAGGRMPATITLGLIPTIAPYRLGMLLGMMQQAYPATQLRIVEDVTENLVRATVRGEVDAAIIATATTDTLLAETPLGDDELVLAVAALHPLAGLPEVEPGQIAGETLLLLKDGHCLSDQTIGFCQAQQIGIPRLSIAASIETLMAMVAAGMGITLIPRMAVDSGGAGQQLAFLTIKPAPVRGLRVVTRRTSRVGPLIASAIREALAKPHAGHPDRGIVDRSDFANRRGAR